MVPARYGTCSYVNRIYVISFCYDYGACSLWYLLVMILARYGTCSFWYLLIMVPARYGTCSLWYLLIMVHARYDTARYGTCPL